MSNRRLLVNILAFQALWWLCVAGRNLGSNFYPDVLPFFAHGWLALLVVFAYVVWHLCQVETPANTLPLLLTALLGMLSDQLLYHYGYTLFPDATGAWIPAWMMALWLAFATTLNVSLRWLQTRYRLAALLGLLFAPPTYWGAQGLGAIVFPNLYSGLLAVGASWAVLMPLLLWIRQQDDFARN